MSTPPPSPASRSGEPRPDPRVVQAAAACVRQLGFEPPPHRLPFETMQLGGGVGLVGLPWVSLILHLPAYRSARYNIRASCDANPQRIAEARAAHLPLGEVRASLEEVIDDPEVRVVDCCFGHQGTGPARRLDVVRRCGRAGKDVLIHKPLALRFAAALELAEAGRAAGIRVAVNQNCRYNPANFAVRHLLTPERLGAPRIIELQASWRGDLRAASSAPAWISHTIHHADLIRWWAGARCVRVTAHALDVATLAIYEFDNGCIAYHHENHGGPEHHTVRTRIACERGVIRHGHNWNWHFPSTEGEDFVHVWRDLRDSPVELALPRHVYEPPWSLHNPYLPHRGPWYDLGAPVAGMMGTLGSLLHANATAAVPDNSIDASLESLRLCLAAQWSARIGAPVDPSQLPPEAEAVG